MMATVSVVIAHSHPYHYTHATGHYDVADGRTVEVRLRPAVGGGVLLGVHEYAVWGTRREHLRWRAL